MKIRAILLGVLAGLVAGGLIFLLIRPTRGAMVTDTTTAALQSIRELNRLTVFTAVLSTAATTTDPGFIGFLDARQTLIASGQIDYYVEFAGLKKEDLRWDATSKTLTISVPDPVTTAPNVNLQRLIRYEDGRFVTMFTGNARLMEKRNIAAIYARLAGDARKPGFLNLARNAARAAIVNNFKLPLKAAGIDANVIVIFPGERG